jgi:cell division protein FtsB
LIFGRPARYKNVMGSVYKFLRTMLLVMLLFGAAILVPLKVFDPNGLPRVERLKKELDALNDANAKLRRENEALRMEIHAFHASPNYVEKVARDELGMVGPDEVIYQFPSNTH